MARNNAAYATAATFGALAGIGGFIHGIGEMLQGNIAPDGIFFDSWVQGPIATRMGGDPAISLIPNLLISGIATAILSLALFVWAVAYVQQRYGGLVMIGLALALLLVGGGVGAPIIGLLAGVAGLGIHAPYNWWTRHIPAGLRRGLALVWPWIFVIAALNGLFLMVGAVILIYFFATGSAELFFGSFLLAVGTLPIVIVTGIGFDLEQRSTVQRPAAHAV